MTEINYTALREGAGGAPPDGSRSAYLVRAKLLDTGGGRLITEWASEKFYWESWNRFDTSGMSFTQDLLDGLGVDRSKLMDDDALEAELARVEGRDYLVRTDTKAGSKGDGRLFTSTYVDGPDTERLQQSLSDIPADVEGLPERPPPEPVGVASAPAQTTLDDDEDIPF